MSCSASWLLATFALTVRAAPPVANSAFVTVQKDAHGVWWFAQNGSTFLSTGVANLNNGGPDDGVGDVLGAPCRAHENGSLLGHLCGDTNNWDMDRHFSPYNNVTNALFSSEQAFVDDAAARLDSWGFNTVTGYSSAVAERAMGRRGLYYNRLLMFGTRFAEPAGTPLQQQTAGGCFNYDVFSKEFEAASDAYARTNVAPRAGDPALLGWHFDKEVSWKKMDLRYWLNPTLYPPGSAGRANATSFVAERFGGDISALNDAWNCSLSSFSQLSACLNPPGFVGACPRPPDWPQPPPPGVEMAQVARDSEAFLLVFARRYFEVVTSAIRRYDRNHLLLGMRGGCFGSTSMLTLFSSFVDVYDRPPAPRASPESLCAARAH